MSRTPSALVRGAAALTMLTVLVALILLGFVYFWAVLNWNYSTGERAGWVQKLSEKGWICKTWEGELSMIAMPGAAPEKFFFTVREDAVAENINRVMGKRVSLRYEEKVGLPTSCFGETRYYVTNVTVVEDPHIPATPSVVPAPPAPPAPSPAVPVPSAPVPTPSATK
jgi:hypothetical protein